MKGSGKQSQPSTQSSFTGKHPPTQVPIAHADLSSSYEVHPKHPPLLGPRWPMGSSASAFDAANAIENRMDPMAIQAQKELRLLRRT